jgi:adenine-specific DNA methylase
MTSQGYIQRIIEVGFPIVEINRLAVPERNSFKPIYQMHKWFARRASCVFRAILLGTLKPAIGQEGRLTDLMEEFYKDHARDPDTVGKAILDPFMGGGTTVVEALRLGCKVVGVDLNPVAWFIVKTEVEPVDLDKLRAAFDRLVERPVAWNQNRPLRETLLDLYKTEIEEGIYADVIYTFWVKHAVCTDPTCGREVPLFKDYIIATKAPSVRYHPDTACPHCKKVFDWEVEVTSMVVDPARMVLAPRGSAGEGRPTQAWAYGPEPKRGKQAEVICPHCGRKVQPRLKNKKLKRKRVSLTVLLCPECDAVWQWRGTLPEGEITCPACAHRYDPKKGNVPSKGKFMCRCGNVDKIIESIRRLPMGQRLPVRPYAIQAYLPGADEKEENLQDQSSFLSDMGPESTSRKYGGIFPEKIFLPKNGKFFKAFSSSDQTRLQRAEALWEENKSQLTFPKSKIPVGEKTKSGLLAHHYNHWHDMFFPRQLIALSTLLQGIIEEKDEKLRNMLLCVFSDSLARNNAFCRYYNDRNTIQEIFSRHDYQPKTTIAEGSVFGDKKVRGTYPQMFARLFDGKEFNYNAFDWERNHSQRPKAKYIDRIIDGDDAEIKCANSTLYMNRKRVPHQCVVTDPPYVGNVNYSELSDFFYVWLRLALKGKYPCFAPEYTPKVEEIVENRSRGKSREDFYAGLSEAFSRVHDALDDHGLLVFTFHHTDQEGLVWEGLLRSLCETGFEIAAVYPIQGESESSLHLMDKENVSYDLIHVCRKRNSMPHSRTWAGLRQAVRKRAREELGAIEQGRYGGDSLNPNDVRLVCIGKCLELYSRHYGKVLDHEGSEFHLHEALQDIGTIVDQLVTRDRPLPAELEDIDAISYVWFRSLMEKKMEIDVNNLNKALRGIQVTIEDLKKAGLIIKGRTGRGRFYKVKQPQERLNTLKERLEPTSNAGGRQLILFDEMNRPIVHAVNLVDILHLLIGLVWAGESVAPWLERYSGLRPQMRAGLQYVRYHRKDWREYIDRILSLVEGRPLLRIAEEGVGWEQAT